ncbi:uncharacterized protein LOC142965619 isoform X2 [Anarhichas minor]|uniref:uncharacterized protein LOC142965619 isoform X2 n=1 Tax=Anarhichas minor TaxID=65739 RepID=UPI003F73ADB3
MAEGEHFVEKHQVNLIKRVSNIAPFLDELLHKNIIQQDSYDEIKALPTSQEKMTALFSGPLESSGGQGKAMFYRFLNEHEPDLIDELRGTEVPVETMMTAKELLLETLNDLSSEELKKFKWLLQFIFLHCGLPRSSWIQLLTAHRTNDLVDVMMEIWNQQSVEVTKEVFMDMNRTDLVQRLSETSSEPKEKHTEDEHWPGLIQKVETMASVIELLLETLAGLSDEELKKFKYVLFSKTHFHRRSSDIQLMLSEVTDKQEMVFLMVLIYGQQSVNKTKEVLKKMNRTDLVQMLSHSSSGPKKKLSDEHRSALIQRAATKAAVKQLLLETLNDLDHSELKKFQEFLQLIVSQKKLPDISSMLTQTADSEETVDVMMQLYGHQSVDLTREVVEKMNRTDLMWRWSESSSALKGEHFVEKHQVNLIKRVSNIAPFLDELLHENIIQQDSYDEIKALPTSQEKMTALFSGPLESSGGQGKAMFYRFLNKHEPDLIDELSGTEVPVETMMTVKELLLELLLYDLSYKELKKFKWLLQFNFLHWGLPQISWSRLLTADWTDDLVDVMVEIWNQQSVEVTKELLMDMNRTDLVQKLSETSSGPKEKHTEDEHWPGLIQKVETMASVIELLLETLAGLSDEELKMFKHVLWSQTHFHRRSSDIQLMLFKVTDKQNMVFLMVLIYGQQSVNNIKEVLKMMNRTDLVQRLSHSSSGPNKKLSDEHRSALIQRVATKVAVKQLLLETLNDLDHSELKKFQECLQLIVSQKKLPDISSMLTQTADSEETVDVMMQLYGHQSVDLTREVVEKMNRTDLMWRWSESSSALKGEHFVEKHQVNLIKRVSNIAPFLDELLHKNIIQQDSYDEIKALPTSQEKMTALFSGPLESSGGQGKAMFYRFLNKHEPDLIDELSGTEVPVETMMTVKELLLETLYDLSSEELKKFKWLLQFNFLHWGLPQISWIQLDMADETDDLVDVMMKIWGQQPVEVTKEVFMDMNRTDLVQRLSETSSGPKEKHTEDEHWPGLIQKVETMASVIELLLETLAGLSDEELKMFKYVLWSQTDFSRHSSDIQLMLFRVTDKQDMVFLMVLNYGQQSVNKTMEVLKKMNRTDLVQRLSHSSSGPKKKLSDEHRSALIQRVATKAAVKQLLLEILNDLDHSELKKFQEFLQLIVSQKKLPDISSMLTQTADSEETVDVMMQLYGHQSVDLTREVVEKMNRTDLKWRWPESSSGLKEHSVDEHQPSLSESEVTMTSVREKLLETLEDLSYGELEEFKLVLQRTRMKKGLPGMSRQRMETADRDEIVKLMMEIYRQQSVEVTSEVLMEMNRSDLVKRLSDFSSGSKGPSGSLELEGCGSIIKDSSDWTKRKPEVNSAGADEAPTYSLQSEAGHFECSVSGLRWICKGKVRFKYQFSSVEEHMERINSMQYMPAGPLMNITVLAGKLDEVHLPHWICIDANPTILDKFAVLHIDDCGDVVEKVSEVTSSHVKLCEPVFSLKMPLVRFLGLSVKIYCNVLIYKTDKTFLTLHVYLIPQDPGLEQELDKRNESYGYRAIRKPHRETSLKMNDSFILTTDLFGAKIIPEKLKLRYENPNFFEVFIGKEFELQLTKENDRQPVWTCTVRKDDYQSTVHSQATSSSVAATDVNTMAEAVRPSAGAEGGCTGADFVDKHRAVLIDRVNEIPSILDELLDKKVITQGAYDEILALPTNREKMRKLYSGPLYAAGPEGKEVFYKILERTEKYLVDDLKKK